MATMKEKTAYLKGLAEGLSFDRETNEGKLLAALIDVVDALAAKVDELDHDVEELNDYAEELDEDLGDVEEYLADAEDEDDECDGDCENCDCDDCEYATETYEVECPKCGEKICFDDTVDAANMTCPACGAKLNESGK